MTDTIKYKGYEIEIFQDDYAESPREWCNLGKMICFHNKYGLGDDHNLNIDDAHILEARDDVFSLPLYLYNHSGITINTTGFNCHWDSGKIGFIYVEKSRVRKEYSAKRISKQLEKRVFEYLIGEVDTYDEYIRGNVYGYTITQDGEHIDSLSGFYGYEHEKSGLMSEAKSAIDCYVKTDARKKQSKVKSYIQNKVPLIYRGEQTQEDLI